MNNELMRRAHELAARNYSLSVFKDESDNGQPMFLAKNPELYGCMAQGETLEKAIKNLEEARTDYIYSLLEDGADIPDPAPEAVMTVDTASPEFTLIATVQYGANSITEPARRKPLYEASLIN